MKKKKDTPKQKNPNKPTWEDILAIEKRSLEKAGIYGVEPKRRHGDNTKEVIFLKKNDPLKPTLEKILKKNPPFTKKEMDLEELYYDEYGNFYPDGYKDEEGNVLGNEIEIEDE